MQCDSSLFSLQSASSRSIKSATDIESRDSSAEKPQTVQAYSERTQTRCSLPLAVDRNLCEDPERSLQTVLSAEYMEKLILLTSSTHSWRPSDDETVDLTEPRFESFVQPNCGSLWGNIREETWIEDMFELKRPGGMKM